MKDDRAPLPDAATLLAGVCDRLEQAAAGASYSRPISDEALRSGRFPVAFSAVAECLVLCDLLVLLGDELVERLGVESESSLPGWPASLAVRERFGVARAAAAAEIARGFGKYGQVDLLGGGQ